MTESHVEQQVQARIAAARVKIQAAKERRESLTAARRAGLATWSTGPPTSPPTDSFPRRHESVDDQVTHSP